MKEEKKKKLKILKKDIIISMISAFFAICILVVFFIKLKIAPFGLNTLTSEDINYSLMDQWGYMKNVLSGEAKLGYSFNMALGGNTSNVFSYALSSPVNLLLILFKIEDFQIFFSLCVMIKLSLIAFSGTFYLRRRFADTELPTFIAIILGLGYAFSQYSSYQIVNIFWLDGVIMLPFILLGIYRIIDDGKPYLLTVSVALAIIFNWYSGVICCIFSIFWFIFEIILYCIKQKKEKKFIFFIGKGLLYGGSGITGALLSLWIFLPTLFAIKNGNRGTINNEIFNLKMNGKLSSAVTNDVLGGMSSATVVSLFCGSFAIIGCLSYFELKNISYKIKILHFFLLAFVVISFYWQPLYLLFSMLKTVSSYWSRYSFVGIFAIIFISAEFFSEWNEENKVSFNIALVFIAIMALLNSRENIADIKLLLITISLTLLCLIILKAINTSKEGKWYKMALVVFALVCCVVESYLNIFYLQKGLITPDFDTYKEYVRSEKEMIESIKASDDSSYRINKSLTRNMKGGRMTANYNEAFAYNYMGISGYTNSPDDRQRSLLDHMGYRINGENYYIVNTSVIPADSLLGIKYFLSDYQINGYEKLESFGTHNNKDVYFNPYYLPMAFSYNMKDQNEIEYYNQFDYLNKIYSHFLGYNVNLFVKLSVTSDVLDDNNIVYNIIIPNGNYAIYGNLPWEQTMNADIYDEYGNFLTMYSKWGSPSIFYIPTELGETSTAVSVYAHNGLSIVDEQFYALDLAAFSIITEELRNNKADIIEVEDNKCVIDVVFDEKRVLFTSIAYDKGWSITDNGREITPILLENCLMQFELEPGEHHIVMKYHIPGLTLGCIGLIVGIGIMIIYITIEKRFKHKIKDSESVL